MKSSQRHSAALPRNAWLLLGVILLVAAGLRLTRLGLVEFKYDEATTARSALAVARQGHLPLVGMVSSAGPRNPALMSYLLAPPFALSRDPRLAAGWLALLGVAAVAITYWLGRTFFDRRVGALAAALFAASPWAVFQSRKLWTQNLPIVTLLFVTALLTLVLRRKSWALAWAMAAAGCLVGLHLGGLAFLFVLGAVLLLFHDHVRPGPLLLGLGLLLVILAPYVVHDARHGWSNLRAFRNLGSASTGLNLRAFTMAARVASGYHLQDLAGTQHAAFVSSLPRLLWIDQLEIALFWLGLLWAIGGLIRERLIQRRALSDQSRARAVLLCWFLVPVALLTRRTPVQPHDFNLLYPVQHLIIALFLTDIGDWISSRLAGGSRLARRSVAALAPLLVVVIVLWQIPFQQALLTFVDNHPTPGGHGAPVKYALRAARRATDLAASEDAALVALLPGGDPRYDGSAAVFDVLLPPHNRRLIDGTKALVLPDRPAVYLCAPQASAATSRLTRTGLEVRAPLPARAGSEDVYRFFRREPGALSLAGSAPDQRRWELPSEQGGTASVSPLGYAWEGAARPGGTLHWTTSWRVEGQPPAGTNLHWFNHVVDEEGARWGQRDGVGLPVSDWRSGDTVITWFDIPISADAPPPPYWVRTGLYTYPEIVNVPLVGPDGHPTGQFLALGPLDE